MQSVVLGSRIQVRNRQSGPLEANSLEQELDVYPANHSTLQCSTVSLVGSAQGRYGWKVKLRLAGCRWYRTGKALQR